MRPRVFVGSSTKGLAVARAIQANLNSSGCIAEIWNQGVFGPGDFILERLLKSLDDFEAAVLVFTADDEIEIGSRSQLAPRDNVVFELGMFMGRRGRDSAFVISPSGVNGLRILSDLGGVVRGEYDPTMPNLQAAVATACDQVVRALQSKQPEPGIYAESRWNHIGQNWRSYGEKGASIDYFDRDISLGEGRYRYPAAGDVLNASWRTIGLRIRRDSPTQPVKVYLATEQHDGTSKKIYFGSHHTKLHILDAYPDELRVPLPYVDFGGWSNLQIAVDEIDHDFVKGVKCATGLRVVGPLRLRNIFLCDKPDDLPSAFRTNSKKFPVSRS